jgi:hypothetical protein
MTRAKVVSRSISPKSFDIAYFVRVPDQTAESPLWAFGVGANSPKGLDTNLRMLIDVVRLHLSV